MSIFLANDYRAFLKTHIHKLPKNGRGEVNRIAAHLRVHSSLVSQILGGKKDFQVEQAQELAEYLGLTSLETDFFILLVQHSRAGTQKLKDYLAAKLKLLRNQSLEISRRIPQDKVLSDLERSTFYSSWIYIAVWLFTSVGRGQTLNSVADRFEVTRGKAEEILRFLCESGLCRLDRGRYVMGHQLVHLERGAAFLSKHHINWRVKAIQRSEDLEPSELMFTSPLSLAKEDFAVLREKLVEFIKMTSDRIAKSAAEEIACLNLDLFWIKK